MFSYFLNPQRPLSTPQEKITLAVDIITVVALATISALVLSGVLHFGIEKIGTLGNGLAWAIGAGTLLAIDVITVSVKKAHRQSPPGFDESPVVTSTLSSSNLQLSSPQSCPFEGILRDWIEESPQDEENAREYVAQKIRTCYQEKESALIIGRKGLTSLPDVFDHFTHLKALSVTNTDLRHIPTSIGKLASLETLNLSGNGLQTLPDSIGNLASLKSLDSSHNRLQTVPVSIGKLASLETLDLSFNDLQTLPVSIGNLRNLKTLTLFHNRLQTLPVSLFSLPSLYDLNAQSNRFSVETVAFIQQQVGTIRSQGRCFQCYASIYELSTNSSA